MPRNRSIQKSKGLLTLPREYDQLLHDYVEILEQTFPNPYELSLKKRVWDWFDIGGQIEFARSPYISNFVKAPNTLAQELPGASEVLKRVQKFDNDSLRTLAEMNSMNLSRLKKRSPHFMGSSIYNFTDSKNCYRYYTLAWYRQPNGNCSTHRHRRCTWGNPEYCHYLSKCKISGQTFKSLVRTAAEGVE